MAEWVVVLNGWMGGRVYGWVHEWLDGRMAGMDRWLGGVGGRMHVHMEVQLHGRSPK